MNALVNKIIQKDLNFRSEGSDDLRIDSEFVELQNLKTLFIDEGLEVTGKELYKSMGNYFRQAKQKEIILYLCFVGGMLAMAVFMKKWGIVYLTRGLVTANAIVGLIPAKWMTNLAPKQE